MTIYPCRECRLSGNCDIQAAKVAGVRGLKLTSIRFACKKRSEDLPPGTHVKAELPYVFTGKYTPDYPQDPATPITEKRILDAIVMKWHAGKVRIFIPRQEAGSLLSLDRTKTVNTIAVRGNWLTPSDGFTPVCKHCGRPLDAEMPDWKCRFEYDQYGGNETELDCEYPNTGATHVEP